MKKNKIIYIIILSCLLFLCGCDNKQESNSNSKPERLSSSTEVPKKEIDLGEFTTKILDQTPNRVDNISLTCNKVNGLTIKKGETFSFCDAIGEVSANTRIQRSRCIRC